MTYREARRCKPGDRILFRGAPGEPPATPEQLIVVAVNDDASARPRTVEITVDSPALGVVTRPHSQFRRPILWRGTGSTFDEILREIGENH